MEKASRSDATVTRRRVVALLGLGAGAGLLAACAPTPPPPKPTEAKPAAPIAPAASPAASPSPAAAVPAPASAAAPAVKQTEAGPIDIPHGLSLTWYGHVPTMVAVEKGFFKEVGLNVELVSIVTSADRMLALTAGSLQWSNLGSAATLAEMAKKNESFYWIGNIDDSPGNNGLVVQPGINDFAGLKGKKVAVTLNSDAEIILYQLLEMNGLKANDVELVPMKAN